MAAQANGKSGFLKVEGADITLDGKPILLKGECYLGFSGMSWTRADEQELLSEDGVSASFRCRQWEVASCLANARLSDAGSLIQRWLCLLPFVEASLGDMTDVEVI